MIATRTRYGKNSMELADFSSEIRKEISAQNEDFIEGKVKEGRSNNPS